MQILLSATNASDLYLKDWAIAYLIGGLVVALAGFFVGGLIWGRSRKAADSLQDRTETAKQDYEKINEELSRLKKQITEKKP